MYIKRLPSLHAFESQAICCTDRHCTGPGYFCIARSCTEWQFGYVSRTCTDARYMRAELHGDAWTECGASLARNRTESNPKNRTESNPTNHSTASRQPCQHAKHTKHTLLHRWRQPAQTLQHELWGCTHLHGLAPFGPPLAWSCTDWMWSPACTELHGFARTHGCTDLHRNVQVDVSMRGLAQMRATVLSIHGFAHLCMEAS